MKVEYPTSYLVWDLETSGLEKENCKILEIGCATVYKGEITQRKSWLLNHQMEIDPKITEITGITKELLDKEGRDPKECFKEFIEILLADQQAAHLTHNGVRFDIEWLAYHVAKTLGWTVGQHKEFYDQLQKTALDTAVFIKAHKLGLTRKWDETFYQWANRVMNTIAKGVKYNVAICCQELGIDASQVTQHRALGDVELTNEIYKKIRARHLETLH